MESANARQVGGDHYRSGKADFQHWDWVVLNCVGYLEAQITRYVSRWRTKNGVEDLEKARHYADKLLEVARRPGSGYQLPLRRGAALRVADMVVLYALTPEEVLIFKTLAEYITVEELVYVRELLSQIS